MSRATGKGKSAGFIGGSAGGRCRIAVPRMPVHYHIDAVKNPGPRQVDFARATLFRRRAHQLDGGLNVIGQKPLTHSNSSGRRGCAKQVMAAGMA